MWSREREEAEAAARLAAAGEGHCIGAIAAQTMQEGRQQDQDARAIAAEKASSGDETMEGEE